MKGGVKLTHSLTQNVKLSDEDMAYEILASQGRAMHYQDLIMEVLTRQERPQDAAAISGVLTHINLDARFAYAGNGEWGLKVWVPSKSSRKLPTITLLNKGLPYDDDNQELELDLEGKDVLFDDGEDGGEEDAELEEGSFNNEESW
ncbi:DNA-directed RNA polymerase delta subunit, putative [Desulfitobacterium hafniense DCB-2]|nr:DNA-directed RNA polymerase subunit delta [Desulfitobacterium hafniense]ACL22840.1 DNA-directed RNA polymerase delta subunit, putative [Desulfitobacterium hafniense DCB-2]KTE93528.1 DNA-directed RNA polymerase subunit delta [Desulfitobacterium hafniense]MEA5025640.1 DNA-directed RNA polymerase subunit delta [Desulfitobacterium hafniense]CDX05104.1 DNA-directed RNA polymerase, delta subunit [Desulfitobacterium hafniense]